MNACYKTLYSVLESPQGSRHVDMEVSVLLTE